MRVENVPPHFEKRGKGVMEANIVLSKEYHWQSLLTTNKMTLEKVSKLSLTKMEVGYVKG